MDAQKVDLIAKMLNEIKNEEEALKVKKAQIHSMIELPPPTKGTVTLEGINSQIKITCRENVSYDKKDLIELSETWDGFADHFNLTPKEDKRKIENFLKTNTGPQVDAINRMRKVSLNKPTISTVQK